MGRPIHWRSESPTIPAYGAGGPASIARVKGIETNRSAELIAHDTEPVTVEQRDGLLVLAAFGVCGMLAVRNAGWREHIDPMIVAKDAADSTAQVAVPMYEAKGQPVDIGGLTVVAARKVIGMTLEALREGWWDCTCEQPHRPDGGCVLQDRLGSTATRLSRRSGPVAVILAGGNSRQGSAQPSGL
ncbi:purine nucleoside phosphorylase [Hamadaea flava]|uniref:Uncharacterized protein n=1 Tax=Hamadaea flava TaxID=1742688 RepID=A0ABV8LZM3_9ACTN|nr:hypothetical protein [Hamadaea flava]MCP2323486.1 purine nucleoside phosphorylase [Hamadaea flava]